MTKKLHYSLAICLYLLTFLSGAAQAQESPETGILPFIQGDFRILTGDVQRPNGIYWHGGYLYTACAGDSTLYRIDAQTGATATYIPSVQDTHMLYVEEGPVVWVADHASGRFLRISPDTGLVPVVEGLPAPWGITPSQTDDSFYMTFWDTGEIANITRDGQVRVLEQGFEEPTGIAATETMLYVANSANARRSIEWVNLSDPDLPDTPQPLVSGVQKVNNLVLAPDGNLYFTYALGPRGAVGRVNAEQCIESGGCANVDVELVIWTELAAPLAGLTISPDMHLYVHTRYGHEIYWLDLTGVDEQGGETSS